MADVLAHHYATALELARAAGEADLAEELESPALRFLTLAGERALGLDTVTALSNLERALALTPAGHPERPGILERFGVASEQAGRTNEAIKVLQEATASFLSRGDPAAAARVMLQLCNCYFGTDDPRWKTIAGEALGHLEPLPPRPELVLALSEMAGDETLQSRHQAGIRYADRALALAEELGLPRPARALGFAVSHAPTSATQAACMTSGKRSDWRRGPARDARLASCTATWAQRSRCTRGRRHVSR